MNILCASNKLPVERGFPKNSAGNLLQSQYVEKSDIFYRIRHNQMQCYCQ